MKINKKKFLFCLCFFSPLVWGQIQYKPLSSPQRHEFAGGFSISTKNWQWKKDFSKNLPSSFLKYAFYFPEIKAFLPESYKEIFIPSLSFGVNILKRDLLEEKNYEICEKSTSIHAFAYHLGLKGTIPYFEFLQPFAELGLARSFCSPKNSEIKRKLKHYFSYGFFLSLKTVDSEAIYSLDQDYGINDVGIKTECLHYYSKNKKDKPFNFCQFGLQFSF